MANKQPLTELWCQFARVTKAEDDENARIVYGLVSDTHVDMDKQRCDGEWLRGSLTKWFNEWGNIRAMHQPIAAGHAISLVEEAPDEWYLTSRIVDPDSVTKIDAGVYKGYSINVAWPKLKRDPKGEAPLGLICGGDIVETSVVDRPSRSAAKIALVKAVGLEAETDTQIAFRDAWEAGDFDKAMNIMKAAKNSASTPTSYSDDSGGGGGNPADTASGVPGEDQPDSTERNAKKVAEGDGTCLSCDCSDCDASDPDCDCCEECGLANLEKKAGSKGGHRTAKLAETRAKLQKHLTAQLNLLKGDPNTEQIDVFKLLSTDELDDSQLALVAADLVRTLMIRELHEQYEPDEPMQSVLGSLSAIYDSLMGIAREEYKEAFEYQAAATISQLITGHTLDQTMQDVALAKMGASLSKGNQALISNAHHALALVTKGVDCDAYMKLAGASSAGPQETTKMADATTDQTTLETENPNPEEGAESGSQGGTTPTTSETETPSDTDAIAELVKAVKAEFTEHVESLTKAWQEEKAALSSELEELRNRAAEDGPLVTAVTKAIGTNKTTAAIADKEEQLTKAWDGARNRQDPAMRTADLRDYLRLRKEIEVLKQDLSS